MKHGKNETKNFPLSHKMLRVTLPNAGFGDRLIDITGLMTLSELLNINVEIHWLLLDRRERFAYTPNLINIEETKSKVHIVSRQQNALANAMEMKTSGVFAPSIVRKSVDLLKEDFDLSDDSDLLQITNKWLHNLRSIELNPIIFNLVPANIHGSIGIHLRRSDKLRNDGMVSWNDMDVHHYDIMMNNMMDNIVSIITDHNDVSELSFYISSEDQVFKTSFKEWLVDTIHRLGKKASVKVRSIDKNDIPPHILADYSNIYDVVEWYALTRCKLIMQAINYSTFSMTASMWANIPLHNFTDKAICDKNWLTHLWKPCLKLVHCGREFSHHVNYKRLSRFDPIAPIFPKSILSYSLCKVFCLTKNEYDLLEDFLLYYGSLVGYENVVLIDNGSTHPKIPEIYKKYENRGVRIHVDRRQMRKQSDMMTDCMRLYQNECEFMLPLDTDEFIYCVNGQSLTMDTIARYLNDAPKVFSGIFYKHVMNSVVDPNDPSYKNFCHEHPARSMTKFKAANIQKVIVRSSAFCYLIMGNHEANTHYGYRMVSADLGLLHFHNTGPARKYERALQTITELGFIKADLGNLSQLLVDCKAFTPCVGGHAYCQFVDFLVRMIAISLWMERHKRLPFPEEIESVDKVKTAPAFEILDTLRHLCDNAQSDPESSTAATTNDFSMYDVLFGNWPTEQWEVEIDQVKRHMDSIWQSQ